MTKGDKYTKKIFRKILREGCLDKDPRPHYEDIYEGAVYDPETNTVITSDNEVITLKENQTAHPSKDKVVIWTPAHTLSVNTGVECSYDLSKGESPLITLRPIAIQKAIGEMHAE